MSIWGTFGLIGEGPGGESDGSVRDYRDGQSNKYPDGTEPHARIYLGLTSWWCVPGWDWEQHDGETDDSAVGEWLQLSTLRSDRESSVYMDKKAALELYHRLGEWLMLDKVNPK